MFWSEEKRSNPVLTFPISRKQSILICLLIKRQHFLNNRVSMKIRAKVKAAKCWLQEQIKTGMRNHNGSLFRCDLK